jgi:tetratricopeptide (TPR) repeat protein
MPVRHSRLLHFLSIFVIAGLSSGLWMGCTSARYAGERRAIAHEDFARARSQLESEGPVDAEGWALLAQCRLFQKDYLGLANAAVKSLDLSGQYRVQMDHWLEQGFIEQVAEGVKAFNEGRDTDAARLFNQLLVFCEQVRNYMTPQMIRTSQKIAALAGAASIRLRDYPNARAYLEGLRSEWNENPALLERLAYIYNQIGEPRLCAATCESLLTREPLNTDVLKLRADAYRQIGDLQATVNAYRDALELDSSSTILEHNLGVLLFDMGDWKQALPHLEASRRSDVSDSLAILIMIGQCHYNEGDYEHALRTFRQVAQVRPDNPDVYREIGACLRSLGNRSEAEAAFQRARQLSASAATPGDSLPSIPGGRSQ